MEFPIYSDDVAAAYRGKSQDIVDAEAKLDAESEEALDAAKKAADAARSKGAGLADALRLVTKAMAAQKKCDEALALAKDELANFRKSSDRDGEAKMLLSLAEAACSKGAPEGLQEAMRSATEARSLFASDKKMESISLVVLAWVSCLMPMDKEKNSKQATVMAMKAKELCQEVGYKKGEAEALHALACAHCVGGASEEALRSADEALDLYLETKNKRMAAFEWLTMAGWHLKEGRADKALSDSEDAQEIYEMLKSPRELDAMKVLFAAHVAEGKPNRARRMAKDALSRFEAEGNKRAEAVTLELLFQAYNSSGRTREALSASERALQITQDLGDKTLECKQLTAMATLQFGMGELDKALVLGEDALALVKDLGTTEDKIQVMQTLSNVHLAKKDHQMATAVVSEMQKHFQAKGDSTGDASALMTLCAIAYAQKDFDRALKAAQTAQGVFQEAGDAKKEGEALRWICEAYMKKEEYKSAVRAAEAARTHFRESGDGLSEAVVLYVLAQSAVSLSVQEGARVENSRASRSSKDALAKGSKAAQAAVKLCRELHGVDQLLACSLCTLSQASMLNEKPDDALQAGDEAIVLFRNKGDTFSEASALLLSADALRSKKSYKDSKAAAEEALSLFEEVDDSKGKEIAQELLDWLQQYTMPQPNPAMMQQMMNQMQNITPVNFAGQGNEDVPAAAVSVARVERERGAALDMSAGLSMDVVKTKVIEIALRIIGGEDGEIEADTPLMEAGLTSNSAILLRDEVSQEIPGVSLPVTLVFDYPSVGAMAELIVESSSKAIKR